MILMLLSCFINLQAQDNRVSPLRGSECETGTTFVKVSIDAIKSANIKLIEREYLIKINNEKDSIICMYDSYTDSIYNDLHNLVGKYNDAVHNIQTLNDINEKQNKRIKNLQTVCFGFGVGVILLILI